MTAQVIAIANRKGGVGKTTTAVNLAAELASRGRRTLVVDLDTQGHSALGLGLDPRAGGPTAHDALRGEIALAPPRPSRVENVDVIPPDPDYQPGQIQIPPLALARALRPVAAHYDHILVDVAPTIEEATIAALAACDRLLIPTQLNHLAYDGVMKFSRAMFRIATLVNRGFQDFAVLPVQVDLRTVMQREALGRLMRDFGAARIFPSIRVDIALAEAFGAGLPVRLYRPQSRGAFDYARIADSVLQCWGTERLRLSA